MVREKTKADPSLRLKDGYGQDDSFVAGWQERYPTHDAMKLRHGWGTHL